MLKLKSKSKTLNLFALLCLGLTLATTHAQRFVKVVNTVEDLVRLNPNDVHTNVFVADPDRGGLFVLATRGTTNQGTAFMSTNATKQWNRQWAGPLDIRWFGAKSGNADDTDEIQAAIDAAPGGEEILIPKGTFTSGSLNVAKSIVIRGQGRSGSILKAKAGMTNHLILGADGYVIHVKNLTTDGNKSNNTSTNNWFANIRIGDGSVVHNVTATNYVRAGIISSNMISGATITSFTARNGAEHSGVLSYSSVGISLSTGTNSNASPHYTIRDIEVLQDDEPSGAGKAPGGVIFAGADSVNSYVTIAGWNWRFYRVGQDTAGNRIGCVELYEDTRDVLIEWLKIEDCYVGGVDAQNCSRVTLKNVRIKGLGADGAAVAAGIEYDPAVRSQDNNDGGFKLEDAYIDGINFLPGETGQGNAIWIHGENGKANDVWLTRVHTTNCWEGLRVDGAQGMEGFLSISESQLFGRKPTSNGKGADIRNFSGQAYINKSVFDGDTGSGLIATTGVQDATWFIVQSRFVTTNGASDALTIRGAKNIFVDQSEFDNTGGGDGVDFRADGLGNLIQNLYFSPINRFTAGTTKTFVVTDISTWGGIYNAATNSVDVPTVKINDIRPNTESIQIFDGAGVQSVLIDWTTGNWNIGTGSPSSTYLFQVREDQAAQLRAMRLLNNTASGSVLLNMSVFSGSGGIEFFDATASPARYADRGVIFTDSTLSGWSFDLEDTTDLTTLNFHIGVGEVMDFQFDTDSFNLGSGSAIQWKSDPGADGPNSTKMTTGTGAPSASDPDGSFYLRTDGTATTTAYIRSAGAWVALTASSSSSLTPTGTITAFGGSAAPTGYLACDGAAVSRTTYAALFAVIGETWGVGDGVTTFNVPDLRGRTVIGTGTGAGLTARTLADTGGEETHVLTEAELPSSGTPVFHNWASSGMSVVDGLHRVLVDTESEGGTTWPYSSVTDLPLLDAGSDDPHNVMQPFAAVTYIIKI